MKIPLRNFEQIIDDTILKRGLTYFQKGVVDPPELVDETQFESTVHGTEDYLVNFQMEHDIITDIVCTCPYDLGPVCKHMAAVIFFLKQDELMLNEPKPKTKRKPVTKGKPKVKSAKIRIQEILDQMPHETLKNYFVENVLNDNLQASKFLVIFGSHTGDESKELYARQIREILKSAAGRHGFIDWNNVRKVGDAVHQLIKQAEQHLVAGNFRSVFLISIATLEEMTNALDFADDSNADIGGNIGIANFLLDELCKVDLPEDMRKEVFNYAVTTFKKETFEGWDWHLGMAELAANLTRNDDEADLVMRMLDESHLSGYELQVSDKIKLSLISKLKGKAAADHFIEKHLYNSEFRELAIAIAFETGDFERAKKLALDGVQQDQKIKPGLVRGWYDWLIKVALTEMDKVKIIEYARFQMLEFSSDRLTYYNLLKQHIAANEWPLYVEDVIATLQKGKRQLLTNFIPDILIAEGYFERLIEFLKNEAKTWGYDLVRLDEYNPYLVSDYREELEVMYETGIQRFLSHASSRKDYQYITKHLRRMKKSGMNEKVRQLIQDLKLKYRQRPALIEELDKV